MKILLAAVFAVLALTGNPARSETHAYLMHSVATQATSPEWRAQATELETIYAALEKQSGVDAKLVYSSDPDVNAFATDVGDEKVVVVQDGLVEYVKEDRDAVAAALGHELAHHKADHIRAGRRKQEGVRILGAILGAVVGAKVGEHNGVLAGAVSGAAVGVGANLIALKFNRNQELEADRLSIDWLIAAGYNPQGMLRLQKKLGELSASRAHSAILSTHPTSEKRYAAAEQLIASRAPSQDLLQRPQQPLVSDHDLADATAAIAHAEDTRIAEVLKPSGAPASALLESGQGLRFDAYAALSNELVFAGDKGKPAVLARHKLTEAKLGDLTETYSTRMAQDPAMAEYFSVHFFRASQGRLAPYGRDLADSYEKGQPLKLEPPYPLETARTLFAEMTRRGAPNLDDAQRAAAESEVLKAQNLSYYDFLIAHNWWSRKARVEALAGDSSLLNAYYSLDADAGADAANAEAAGVHVGGHVHIGSGVRIGDGGNASRDTGANGEASDATRKD
jgi:Zn-dependent protease with chaperone function